MNFKKIIAAILIVLGIILITYGITELNSLESQLTRALGRNNTNTIASIVSGALSIIIGLYLLVRKG